MADDIEDEDFLLSQLTAEEIAELSEIIDPDVLKQTIIIMSVLSSLSLEWTAASFRQATTTD